MAFFRLHQYLRSASASQAFPTSPKPSFDFRHPKTRFSHVLESFLLGLIIKHCIHWLDTQLCVRLSRHHPLLIDIVTAQKSESSLRSRPTHQPCNHHISSDPPHSQHYSSLTLIMGLSNEAWVSLTIGLFFYVFLAVHLGVDD